MLGRIEYAGANEQSFEAAARSLEILAEMPISAKHVQRITERVGEERLEQRDAAVEAFKSGKLKPAYAAAPEVAAVHLDAGKIQLRDEKAGPGVSNPRWGDTKVGCFLTYAAPMGDTDPQPEPPSAFVDPERVARLCGEIERVRGGGAEQRQHCRDKQEVKSVVERKVKKGPARLVRTAVATMGNAERFGWMVAAEAMKRGFYGAARKAVVGNGGNWIVPLAEMHFPGWVQVLDFLHLLAHLYGCAMAAYRGYPRKGWACYERWVRWAWAGEAGKVLEGVRRESRRLGEAPEGAAADDPRRLARLTVEYIKANIGRMDYARYRTLGLPMTSAAVESLIKQFNQRVKGTEKFWASSGAESVLQSRAAYLSEDGRAQTFYQHRPRGRAVGQRRRCCA